MASKKTKNDGEQQTLPMETAAKPAKSRSRGRKPVGGAATAASGAATPQGSGRVVVEREIGGRTLTIETGRFAKQADGSCVVRYGDTMVLATAQSGRAPEHLDFFPLTVDYREKTAAGGLIPGGFFKREGRPSTKEILCCRQIDRSIRPMFPDGFRREVQVLSQVLSTDRENDPDVVAGVASFAALALSSIPNGMTLGMCRIGLREDKLTVNPTWSVVQSAENQLNLIVAGHRDAIVMVEAGAKQISEAAMLEALELGHKVAREIAEMIDELIAKAGKPKMAFDPPAAHERLREDIEKQFGDALRAAPVSPGAKHERSAATKAVKDQVAAAFPAPQGSMPDAAKAHDKVVAEICKSICKAAERLSILGGTRADGRDHTTVRPITIDVGPLPRVHGSVLFTRGETQALGIVTLGGTDDQQIIDGLMPQPRKRFLLHYAFPPFSVGEVKRIMGPGRREIGHGALAERSLESILPAREDFPYTIRITSEILESNGSSSMATVCAGTMAMMDAGVKITQPVAGIAMGLVMEGKKFAILSDILGSEDACGDMDFKVAGTGNGITALQMDIKCDGLTRQIMSQALEQAREGRLHILREMLKALRAPRAELSPNAPRLESLTIPTEKIGLVIGPGGRNIRQMQEDFECKINIEDGGLCTITGVNSEKVMTCVDYIRTMTAEVELGGLYEGRVTAIKEFGAFIEVLPSQEGLCHVSELSDGFLQSVTDAVRIGDVVKVKVIGIDDFGKIKLSRKAVLLAERGVTEDTTAGGGDRPDRGRDRGRPDRGFGRDRDRGERPERFERGERPERGERGPRPDGDRGERSERPDRGERSERPERGDRGPRPDGDRGERSERPDRGDRGDRGPRPDRSDRGERSERPDRDRGDRGPRPDRDRGERSERPDRDRGDRGPRPEGDRGERGERPDRGGRGERPDRERGSRGGRDQAGDSRRGGPPMAEFDPVDADLEPFEPPVTADSPVTPNVGELEEAEAVFGDEFREEPDREGDDRGPRQDRRPRRR